MRRSTASLGRADQKRRMAAINEEEVAATRDRNSAPDPKFLEVDALLNLVRQDLTRGQGLCLIDPHGDLAQAAAAVAGADHLYRDVADSACPLGYNPLTHVAAEHRPLVASGILDALKKQWEDAWGPRMEHLLRMALPSSASMGWRWS